MAPPETITFTCPPNFSLFHAEEEEEVWNTNMRQNTQVEKT